MTWNFRYFLESIMLGAGLAMDAFCVSMADGMNEPKMTKKKFFSIATLFSIFQGLMPLIGWVCVHTLLQYFKSFETFIPFIALGLLLFIGGKMFIDGLKKKEEDNKEITLGIGTLFLQALATSIDALSVGFTIAEQSFSMAIVTSLIISIITFGLCLLGILIGKKFGTKLTNKAQILGGIILIAIGIEIFLTGIL